MSESHKLVIAIVSYERDPARDLASCLTALGHQVEYHSPRAIAPVTGQPPDLVAVNVLLADENGHFQGMEAILPHNIVPIVYFGTPSEKERLSQFFGRPLFFLSRPFVDQDLKNTLETARYVADLDKRRRRAEDELSEKMAFLKAVSTTARVAGCEIDAETLKFTHTGQGEHFAELPSRGHSTIEKALECIHPQDRSGMDQAIREALAEAKSFDLDIRLKATKANQNRWARIICHPYMNHDRMVKLIGTIHDITHRKQTEQNLEKEKTLLKAIIDSIPVMITRYDPEANMLYLNKFFENQVGWTTEDVKKINLVEQVYPDPDYRREALEYMQQASTRWKAFRLRSKSGRIIESEWSNIKLEDGTQIGIGIDISKRKRAEVEKELLEEQLRQSVKMQAIGTLAGGIAHDFNNLLQAILGHTQIMLLDKTQQSDDYNHLKSIQHASEQAARLVNQLLLFSRKAGTVKKPISLNREMEQILITLKQSLPGTIDIAFEPDDSLWTVNADRVQIEQALMNLGLNAAESMPSGGRLLIETHNITFHENHMDNHVELKAGPYVRLTVSDTGQGIRKEILPHIFEPFFTTKEVGRGSGLGLASVYGIVINHGGHIVCHSREGEGAAFRIYLPAVREKPSSEDKPAPPPSTPVDDNHPPTILLVDDDEAVRDCSSAVFERFGYNVLLSRCGEEALDIFRQQHENIDLIVLDLGMPGMGGQRCLEEIITLKPSTRIVIASGSTMENQIRQALDSGAADFIGKPYKLDALLNKVRGVLNRPGDS